MKRLLTVVLCVLLGACVHAPKAPPQAAPQLLHDTLFGPPTAPVNKAAIFVLTDAMQAYVKAEFGHLRGQADPRNALLDALYKRRLQLSYDAASTRNAAQAFEARAGNCLSLVIMTAAFAKQLGLPVSYQSVQTDEIYSRSGDLTLASGHVNLVLEKLPNYSHFHPARNADLVVDFLPANEIRGQLARSLSETTVVAMYLNNRAAELLAQGDLDNAYHWAREAVLQDPGFGAAVNTLGVIYLRRLHLPQAEAALRHLLTLEPENTAGWSNLALVLQRAGRPTEAQAAQTQLLALQPVPPLFNYDQGRQAMEQGDYRRALAFFERELRRQPYQPEVHFWTAQAYWRLGEEKQAVKHMRLAVENSNSLSTHDLYAAKLAALRAHRLQ